MWHSQIADWDKVDDQIYQLVMSESEKMSKDTLDDSEKITNRAYTLINILILLIGIFITYVIKNVATNEFDSFLSVLSIVLLIPILICFYLCYGLVKKRTIYRNGTNPNEILIPKYIDRLDYNDADKYKRLALFVIEQNQEKIRLVEENNSRRVRKYQTVLRILFYSFITSLTIIIGFAIFLHLGCPL